MTPTLGHVNFTTDVPRAAPRLNASTRRSDMLKTP